MQTVTKTYELGNPENNVHGHGPSSASAYIGVYKSLYLKKYS